MKKAKITTGKRPQLVVKETPAVVAPKVTKERKKKNV